MSWVKVADVCSEELEHAKARGAKIYAEVAGVGGMSVAGMLTMLTASHPEGLGAKIGDEECVGR